MSAKGAWTKWCLFFLESLHNRADENLNKAKGILVLYDKMKGVIPGLLNSKHVIQAVDWIFTVPVFSGSNFVSKAGIPPATAHRILPLLTTADILKILVPTSGRRSAVYCFPELLNLTEGRRCI